MKSLSSLDIYFLVKELQILEQSRLDKVYQGEGDQKGDFTFQLNKQGAGKQLLRFMLPSMLYITPLKPDYNKMPGHFATFLRRNLGNARILKIQQQGFERIVELTIENKNGEFTLILELIQPGNIFLLNSEKKIISLLTPKKLSTRTLRGGVIYEPPPEQFNIITAAQQDIIDKLNNSTMDSIVKSIAIDLGLGGVYAEEICARANVDKAIPAAKADLIKVAQAIKALLQEPPAPNGNEKDVFPITMKSQNSKNTFETFSLALFSTEPIIELKKSAIKTKKDKSDNVLKQQQAALEGYNISADENQKKGELIYENYQEIETLLKQINKARETMSWQEIKKKLKNKRIVKIDESKGTITVEF